MMFKKKHRDKVYIQNSIHSVESREKRSSNDRDYKSISSAYVDPIQKRDKYYRSATTISKLI